MTRYIVTKLDKVVKAFFCIFAFFRKEIPVCLQVSSIRDIIIVQEGGKRKQEVLITK